MPKKPARPSLEALRQSLSLPDRHSFKRWELFQAYSQHPARLEELPFLRELLRHHDHRVVNVAAASIGKLGPAAQDAAFELYEAAGKSDPDMSMPQAYIPGVDALLRIGAPAEMVLDLVRANFGHSNWYYIRDSLSALKRLNTPKAWELLGRIVVFWWPDLDPKQRRYLQKHFPEAPQLPLT